MGISCLSHDAAVAMVKEHQIVFASHSERYTEKKNDPLLCKEILEDAQKYGGLPKRLVFYEKPYVKKIRQLVAGQYKQAFFDATPHTYLKNFFHLNSCQISYVEHHLSHACGGYYTSPFRDASIVVIDGIGEWNTISVWKAKDRNLTKVFEVNYPDSLGLFYSAFTQRVGLKPNEEEYIMMSMAALGEPEYVDLIKKDFVDDVPAPYFSLKVSMHRGIKDWEPRLVNHMNIAASVQKITEDYLINLFKWVGKQGFSKNLVYSGGMALNCVANEKLARLGLFDNIWIMPNPGDAGSSLGAVLAFINDWVEWRHPYLGHDICRSFNVFSALEALLRGEIIGIANGRAEFGPRALGNRSLIADPRILNMKDRVNRIKKREPFRPFSPIILEECVQDYFDMPVPVSPYMQFTAKCKFPNKYPAICHIDKTSRVQTINKKQNPRMYELLKLFQAHTGCPMLLNTSLNIKGKPLVNTWNDAIDFSETYGISVF